MLSVYQIVRVGAGTGAFIANVQDPVVNFILVFGLIAGVLSIFMAVAFVIKSVLAR